METTNQNQPEGNPTDAIQPIGPSTFDPPEPTTPTPSLVPPAPAQPTLAQQPPAGTQPQMPPKMHLYDRVLQGMAGGPTRTQDPATGEVKEVPMTRKSLTAHILAGAITGILSNAQGQDQIGPAGTRTPGNMAALAGGAQATQQKLEEIRQAPQKRMDEQAARKAATMKNNYAELQYQIASDKLHEEDWTSKEDHYTKAQDLFQPMLTDIENSDKALTPGQPSLFVKRKLGHDDAAAALKGHSGDYLAIQDGWTTETHEDGRTYHVPTFSIVRNAGTINVSRETMGQLAQYNSQLSELLANSSAPTVPMSPTLLKTFETQARQAQTAESFVNRIRKDMDPDAEDVKGFNEAYKNDPELRGQVESMMGSLGSMGTVNTTSALDDILKGKSGAKLVGFMGKSPKEIEDYVNERRNDAIEASAKAKGAAQIQIAQIKTQGKPLSPNIAASILADPNSAPVDRARAQAFQNILSTQKTIQEKSKAEIDRAIKVGNTDESARMLYEGTLTLSQLKARSSDARFITEVTSKAQQMAKSTGNATWTPQLRETQFKNAQSPQNVAFFGNVNSLLDPQGTLAQLEEQYAKLGNGQFPIFNKWEDYLAYEAGLEKSGSAMAGFGQTLIGVADDYAKVMGGGVGTDQSRMQVIQSLTNKHNPAEMHAAVEGARNAVKSQAAARIGSNPIMQTMFGDNVPENQERVNRIAPKAVPQAQSAPQVGVPARPQGTVGIRQDASGNHWYVDEQGNALGMSKE